MKKIKSTTDLLSLKGILSDSAIKGKTIDQIIKLEHKAIAEVFAERNRPKKKSAKRKKPNS